MKKAKAKTRNKHIEISQSEQLYSCLSLKDCFTKTVSEWEESPTSPLEQKKMSKF